jgi:hypothetical protein
MPGVLAALSQIKAGGRVDQANLTDRYHQAMGAHRSGAISAGDSATSASGPSN